MSTLRSSINERVASDQQAVWILGSRHSGHDRHEDTPQMCGMINKINHLVEVEQLND